MRAHKTSAFAAWTVLQSIIAGVVHAASCATTTTRIVVPTTTYTFLSTYVTTVHASTARDLGTFTQVTTIRTTKTLKELTSTVTDCTATTTFVRSPTVTIYTTAPSITKAIRRDEEPQNSTCTLTATDVTTYGATYTWKPANKTSTFTDYTLFTMKTVSSTTSGGTTYTIGTRYKETCKACGPTVDSPTTVTPPATTVTYDAKCAPTALVSAAGGSPGHGILYLNEVPYGGAAYRTNTTDGSACCQLCVEAGDCAASAWDIRTSQCHLLFSAQWDTGVLNCGNAALAFYNYGPNHPMTPGTGWYIGTGCGYVQYAGAKPDDGS